MPRKSLAETVSPEDIIYKDEDIGSVPNLLLPDEKKEYTYGIYTDDFGYHIVKLKDAYKTEDIDGESRVIHYNQWVELKHLSTFTSAYLMYIEMITKRKDAQTKKSKNIQDIIDNHNYIKTIVEDSLKGIVNDQSVKVTETADKLSELNAEMSKARQQLRQMIAECDELTKLIKEKRKIVIGETKERKQK